MTTADSALKKRVGPAIGSKSTYAALAPMLPVPGKRKGRRMEKDKKTTVVTFVSSKGGVGKTSDVILLAK